MFAQGSRVTLAIEKVGTGSIEQVVLKRVPMLHLSSRKRVFEALSELQTYSHNVNDAQLSEGIHRCFEAWSALEMESCEKDEVREQEATRNKYLCEEWLAELHSLLDLGLDLSGDSTFAKEIFQHKTRQTELEEQIRETDRITPREQRMLLKIRALC